MPLPRLLVAAAFLAFCLKSGPGTPAYAQTYVKLTPLARTANDHVRRASHFIGIGDYTRAITELTRALEIEPECGDALRFRAESYLRVAEAADRAEDLSRKLTRTEDRDEAATLRARRAFAFYNMGSYDRAAADYTVALELRSDWSLLYLGRALAHAAAGRHTEAEADYNRALPSLRFPDNRS